MQITCKSRHQLSLVSTLQSFARVHRHILLWVTEFQSIVLRQVFASTAATTGESRA